jgi:hypothetical protein
MKQVKTLGRMISGKAFFQDLDRFWQEVSFIDDGPIEIIVKKSFNRRSDNQNEYYWAAVIEYFRDGFLDYYGEPCSKEEAHIFLKNKFNYTEMVHPGTGEIERIIRDSRTLDTQEFTDYIEKCRAFIQEWFNITVPDPIKSTNVAILDHLLNTKTDG